MRLLSIGILFCSLTVHAQQKAVLYFNDKPEGVPGYSLSEKASERRAKLGVTYDWSDLPLNETYISELEHHQIKIVQRSKWLNAVLVEGAQLMDCTKLPFVRKVELVQRKRSGRATSAVDHPVAVELKSDKNFRLHHGEVLANHGYTGRGMHIAVFDAGFRGLDTATGFRSLFTDGRIQYTQDLVGNSSVFQYDQHGTQTLSVMAGRLNDEFTGTAVDANYSLFVTENAASETLVEEFNWAVAAEKADSLGVDVISSSLGYTTFDDPSTDHTHAQLDGRSTVVTQAAVLAARKGILVVNSAGNYRGMAWKKIGCPADADSIIAVAAVNEDSVVTSFSSPGPSADGRIKPDVSSLGLRTAVINSEGKTAESNGTSFSTPLIAGLCASLWQADPSLSNMKIREIVLQVSHKFAAPDTNFGYGIPNFEKALSLVRGYDLKSGVVIFPNPSAGGLFIGTGNISGEVEFELITSLGQLLANTSKVVERNSKVDISELIDPSTATGTYFLRIKHQGGSEERSLILR